MKHISDTKLAEIAKMAQVSTDTVAEWLYADWDNGEEHEDWIQTAPVKEIAEWIESNVEASRRV